ncbi:MAG: type II toxin-antitoxin system HicA family toxin [Lachnospiraceae bacterium]|nr:type II toxin-antitoxin system HicA family toxin [Lachnospiraceae bacterium]
MKSYSSREVIRQLETAGWVRVRVTGSHYHFRHPDRPGIVTVKHPCRDIPPATLKSISRQSGIDFE